MGRSSSPPEAVGDGDRAERRKGRPHWPIGYITPDASHRLAADFTGDGKPDVFSVNSTDRPLFSLYVNSTPA